MNASVFIGVIVIIGHGAGKGLERFRGEIASGNRTGPREVCGARDRVRVAVLPGHVAVTAQGLFKGYL